MITAVDYGVRRKSQSPETKPPNSDTPQRLTPPPKQRPPTVPRSRTTDVMVVGEPTLMGGEFGDEDERLITRLENSQFEPNNTEEDNKDFQNSPALQQNPRGQDKKTPTGGNSGAGTPGAVQPNSEETKVKVE